MQDPVSLEDDRNPSPNRFGIFLAPFHSPAGNPAMQLRRDLALIELVDQLGFEEAWVGEHHSAGFEIIGAPEQFLAAAAERTSRIKLGTGVSSLPYHNPLTLASRIVQLDNMSLGRAMLGIGPGQLVGDAKMLGIDPTRQRDMMIEAAEIVLALFRGEYVTHKADWFTLDEAHLQLRPYARDGIEVAVASTFSPTGATLAGRLGLGLLSLAATHRDAFDLLDQSWGHLEKVAAEHGQPADRTRWRIVAPMHLAETREQARRDIEAAIIPNWVSYLETVGARQLAANGGEAVEKWTTEGLGLAGGVATVGTPDDAIETIRRLMAKSGGFGAFLLMAHNAAPWPATRRSYELFAEYVIPEIRRLNDGRYGSMNWYRQNAREFRREGTSAINEANRRYGTESRLPELDDDEMAPAEPGAGG